MMNEYITKEQALQALEIAESESINAGFSHLNLSGFFALELAKITAADVAPVVHGKWFQVWSNEQWIECSCCGIKTKKYHKNEFKYCPNCGAKMEYQYRRTDALGGRC